MGLHLASLRSMRTLPAVVSGVVLALCATTAAAETVRGRVLDRKTGDPVEGAAVFIAGADGFETTVATDGDGRYAITVKPGKYKLTFLHGDARVDGQIAVVDGADTTLDARLKMRDRRDDRARAHPDAQGHAQAEGLVRRRSGSRRTATAPSSGRLGPGLAAARRRRDRHRHPAQDPQQAGLRPRAHRHQRGLQAGVRAGARREQPAGAYAGGVAHRVGVAVLADAPRAAR